MKNKNFAHAAVTIVKYHLNINLFIELSNFFEKGGTDLFTCP